MSTFTYQGIQAAMTRVAREPSWLLLIHQIPSEPAYLRVKVGRRLARVGAVQLKSSVYVLPSNEACREDLSWIRREIADAGGEAALLEATALEGLHSTDIERLFREARAADYRACAERLAEVEEALRAEGKRAPDTRGVLAELARVEEQVREIERIDFFASGEAEGLRNRLAAARSQAEGPARKGEASRMEKLETEDYQRRTWVTRAGVKVDRVACAWLIQRFIDREPRFRFVDPGAYSPRKGELRFDMPDGEFTHEGDLCSFEVLCRRFELASPGLSRIAEIVHDLDVKDGRYAHPETEGIRVLIQGIVSQHEKDEARIAAAGALFDAFLASAQSGAASKKR